MIVSICPSFSCNQRCSYCYLGKLREDSQNLKLDLIQKKLEEIASEYSISGINIFGGEISILGKEYFQQLLNICYSFTSNVSCTSNLNQTWTLKYKEIDTSINPERNDYLEILNKLKRIQRKINVSYVILKELSKNEILEFFNQLPKTCEWITFYQYSPSIYNSNILPISYTGFEETMIKILSVYLSEKYLQTLKISNIQELINSIDLKYDNSAKSNVFLLPNGKFGTISYTDQNLEFFIEYDKIGFLAELYEKEQEQYFKKCSYCKYFRHCYCEHLNLNRCCGNKKLLKFIEERRYDLLNILKTY